MKTDSVLILNREDMFEHTKTKAFDDIVCVDFKFIINTPLLTPGIVVFVDDSENGGKSKILKNRYA